MAGAVSTKKYEKFVILFIRYIDPYDFHGPQLYPSVVKYIKTNKEYVDGDIEDLRDYSTRMLKKHVKGLVERFGEVWRIRDHLPPCTNRELENSNISKRLMQPFPASWKEFVDNAGGEDFMKTEKSAKKGCTVRSKKRLSKVNKTTRQGKKRKLGCKKRKLGCNYEQTSGEKHEFNGVKMLTEMKKSSVKKKFKGKEQPIQIEMGEQPEKEKKKEIEKQQDKKKEMEKEERNKKRRIRIEEEESERLKKKKEEECEKQQNEKEEMEKEEHNERWRLRMEREERDRLKKEKEEEIEKQQNEQKKMEKEERNERWRLRVEKEERDRLKKEKEVEKESLENEETFSRTINVGDLISFSEIPGYSDFLFEIFRVLEVNRDIAAFLVANRKKHIWFSKEDFSYDQIKFTKQKKGCSSHNCVLSNAEFQMSNSIEEDHVRRALSKVYCDVIRFGTTLIKSSDVFNFLCKKDNKVVVKVEKVDVEMKQIYVSQGDKSNWIDFSDGLYSKVCYFRSRSTVTRCRNLSEYTFHQKIQDKFAHPILYSSLNSILESTWMLDKPYLRVNDWKLKISDIKSEMVNFNICNAWTTRIMKPLGSYEAYVSKLDQYFEDIKFCSNYLLFSFKAMAFLSLITKMPSEIKHNIQFCESVIEVHNHIDDYGFEEIKSELKNGIITYQGVLQRAKKDDKARIEAINNVLIFMGDVVNVVMSGKVEFISWLNIQLEFESKFAYKYSRLDYTSRRRRLGINQKQHMQTFLKIDMVEEIRHDKSRACTEIFQRIAVDPTDMETIVSNAVEDFYRKIYRLYHSDYVHVWEIEGDNTLHNYYGYIDLAQERIRVIVAGNYYCLSERNTYVAKTMEIKVHQLFHLHCGPHIPLWKYSV